MASIPSALTAIAVGLGFAAAFLLLFWLTKPKDDDFSGEG